MSDYKELISDLRDADQVNWKRLSLDAAAAIEALQAQLPKRGEWKPFDLTWGRSIYSCTVCGEAADVPTANGKVLYNYCPNCGAKMEVQDAADT